MYLAGDVGGTKILLEVGETRSGTWQPAFHKRYSSEEITSFPDVLHDFVAEWDSRRDGRGAIDAAAFGVAGAVIGNKAKMTNRPWAVDGDLIARRFEIPRARVVNDLVAGAHAIEWLAQEEIEVIQPGEIVADAPRVVLGVGTGLGVSYRVFIDGKAREIGGEAGHRNFGPSSIEQVKLWRSIFATHGRVSDEHVLSGPGLRHVQQFKPGQEGLDLFVSCLGSVAGDHAVGVLARGGVYLMGGIIANVPGIIPALHDEHFRSAFCAKGPFSSMLMKVPVLAVKTERAVVIGAARFAAEV